MDHKDRVRSHYDAHAGNNVSTREALQQRRQGAALPLKLFHNDIKRRLLAKFARRGCSLLDLCCGRGGDLQKWRDCGVRYVYGVDISRNEVDEAMRRYQEMLQDAQRRKRPVDLEAQFECSTVLGEEEFEADGGPFDVVTCMFAMHYFFESERKLRMFVRNVSRNLKPGGVFIGTIPDGKRILWHLGGKAQFNTKHLKLEKRWEGDHHKQQAFGNAYLWDLHDTVTASVDERSEGSVEFLTFTQPITRIAAHYDMLPVLSYEDPQLEGLFEEEDGGVPFKHFFPQFPPETDMSLAVASSCFMAFVFRKLDVGEEMPILEPPLIKTIPLLEQQQQQQEEPGGDEPLQDGGAEEEGGEDGRAAKRARLGDAPAELEEGEDGGGHLDGQAAEQEGHHHGYDRIDQQQQEEEGEQGGDDGEVEDI